MRRAPMLIRDFLPHVETFMIERYGEPTRRYLYRGRPHLDFGDGYIRVRLDDAMVFHLGLHRGGVLGWMVATGEAADQKDATKRLSNWMRSRNNPNRERPVLRTVPNPAPRTQKPTRQDHDCGWTEFWNFESGYTEQQLMSIYAVVYPYEDDTCSVVAVKARLGCLLCGAKIFYKGHIENGRVVWQRNADAPPYRLSEWFFASQEAPELLVVEGEKCADAVAIHQRTYVTSLESLRPETLWYLRGFRVSILADRDGLGMNAAALKRVLEGVAASVEIIEDDPKFNDIADRLLFELGPQAFCYWTACSPLGDR